MLWKSIKHLGIRLIKNWIVLLVIGTWLLTILFKNNPHVTELLYSQLAYPIISIILSNLSNLFPFSLNDLGYTLLVVLFISIIVLLLIKKIKLKKAMFLVLKTIGVFYIFFYWLWGFNYFRAPVYERMQIENKVVNDSILEVAYNFVVKKAAETYCVDSLFDKKLIDLEIENSYKKLAETLVVNYPNGKRKPKKMVFSRFNAGAGISGYFGPFSNEIHMNGLLMPMQYPAVLAHEKAHQFGITSEAEASFYAWLVCSQTQSHAIQYSANLFVLRYFLRQVDNEEQMERFIALLPMEVANDLITIKNYWKDLRNPLIDEAQSKLYDMYLKGNNISDGVKNYGGVVKLVCEYEISKN
ncbi:MAG: DUF3810 domain-containing protein [Salinivirgaceae bacterium]|jgi:hypothetical protein|nr:DUF3810 domain-containing protein [Salinivirgaceae bacterium]